MVWKSKPSRSAASRQSARSSQAMRCIVGVSCRTNARLPVEPKPPRDAGLSETWWPRATVGVVDRVAAGRGRSARCDADDRSRRMAVLMAARTECHERRRRARSVLRIGRAGHRDARAAGRCAAGGQSVAAASTHSRPRRRRCAHQQQCDLRRALHRGLTASSRRRSARPPQGSEPEPDRGAISPAAIARERSGTGMRAT